MTDNAKQLAYSLDAERFAITDAITKLSDRLANLSGPEAQGVANLLETARFAIGKIGYTDMMKIAIHNENKS